MKARDSCTRTIYLDQPFGLANPAKINATLAAIEIRAVEATERHSS
jgi:hypothetical protein